MDTSCFSREYQRIATIWGRRRGLKWNFLRWFLRISSSITSVAISGHSLPFCIHRKQGDARSTPAAANFLIIDSTKVRTGKRESRGIAPLNPNIGTKGRWVASLISRLLYCRETAHGAQWMGDCFSPTTTNLHILVTKFFPYRESKFDSPVVQPAALSLNQLRYTYLLTYLLHGAESFSRRTLLHGVSKLQTTLVKNKILELIAPCTPGRSGIWNRILGMPLWVLDKKKL